jgi:hypothetical protein
MVTVRVNWRGTKINGARGVNPHIRAVRPGY